MILRYLYTAGTFKCIHGQLTRTLNVRFNHISLVHTSYLPRQVVTIWRGRSNYSTKGRRTLVKVLYTSEAMARPPEPRYDHAAVCIGSKLIVWGGRSKGSATISADTIESFDISSETWKQPQQVHGSLPGCLSGMAVTTNGENAYSFGGQAGSTRINTLYEINMSTLQCRELVPANPADAPPKTSNSRIVYYKDKLVLHGGYTGQHRIDEIHVFDLKNSE